MQKGISTIMKKILTIVLTVALMLSALSLLVLNTAAEENESSFKFGNATVDLSLIEDFHSAEGSTFMNWGQFSIVEEMFKIEVSGGLIWDAYNLKTGMLSGNTTYTGAENFVFSIKNNRSDGDIFFAFQPHSPTLAANDGNLFTGWVEGQTIWLVDEKGKATEAKKCPSVDLMSGRAGYIIPMGFEGYIVFPMKNLVIHGDWGTTYYSDLSAVDIDAVGFHVALDDATYAEFCIDDMFVCGALPAYEAPTPETQAPETNSPETNSPETNAPETNEPESETVVESETAPESTAPESTAPESTAPETNEADSETVAEAPVESTDAPAESGTAAVESETKVAADGGCSSVLTGLCVLPLALLGVAALRRRED